MDMKRIYSHKICIFETSKIEILAWYIISAIEEKLMEVLNY